MRGSIAASRDDGRHPVGRNKLTVRQVCAQIPGRGGDKPLHGATVTRWIVTGAIARDGTRVKLHATRAGSRWLIDQDDLKAFFERLTAEPANTSPPATSPAVTDTAFAERARRADERLRQRIG